MTGLDYIVVANPMPLPQSLRNNEIERLFERLVAGIAEQPLGARIPKANDAGSIRGYDRVGTTESRASATPASFIVRFLLFNMDVVVADDLAPANDLAL